MTSRFNRDKNSYFWLPSSADAKDNIATMTDTAILNEIRAPGMLSTKDHIIYDTLLGQKATEFCFGTAKRLRITRVFWTYQRKYRQSNTVQI